MITFDCKLPRPDFALDAKFEAKDGITALFGPSGSGKTTVIRTFAGLEPKASGKIMVGEDCLLDTDAGISVAPYKRRAGLVFQNAQLFPHLDVSRNLSYARRFVTKSDQDLGFDTVTDVLGINHLLERKPHTLSGGERQRVAIGRALLSSPRILLFDEPLASLDLSRKLEILSLIEKIRDTFKIPIVYVSHSADEIARLASHVIRMANGRVVTRGTAADVLSLAKSEVSADRFDLVSMISAKVEKEDPNYSVTILAHPAGKIVVPYKVEPGQTTVQVVVRATNVTLALAPPGAMSVRTVLEGEVRDIQAGDGPFALVGVQLIGGDRIHAYMTRMAAAELKLRAGVKVFALAKTVAMDERGIAGLRLN